MKHSSRLSNIHVYLINVDVTILELMLYQMSGLTVYFYPIIETFSNVALALVISILFCIFTSAEAAGESNSTASNQVGNPTQQSIATTTIPTRPA